MRRKLITVIVVLLVIIAGVLAWAVSNAGRLVASHKQEIADAASNTLGSPVELGDIAVHVFPNTSLVVGKTTVGRTKSSSGISLDNVTLRLNLWALLSGTLSISELSLVNPSLAFVATDHGVQIVGLPTLGAPSNDNAVPAKTTAPASAPSSPLALRLSKFSISGGSITFTPQAPAKPITVKDLDVSAGLNLSGSTVQIPSAAISARVQGELPVKIAVNNASLDLASGALAVQSGNAALSGNTIDFEAAVNIKNMQGNAKVSSSGIELAGFKKLVSAQAPVVTELLGKVAPNITVSLNGPAQVGAQGAIALNDLGVSASGFDVRNTRGSIAIAGAGAEQNISSEKIDFTVNDQPLSTAFAVKMNQKTQNVNVTKFSLNAFGGSLNDTSTLSLAAPQRFTTNAAVTGMAIGDALKILRNPVLERFTGTLSNAKADLQGELGENLTQSLNGKVSFTVTNGKIEGVNVIGPVLRALAAIPSAENFLGSLPPSARTAADATGTAFDSASGNLAIAGGNMNTNDLNLRSPLFELQGQGGFGFDGGVNLNATIFFEKDMALSITNSIKQLRKLLTPEGKLEIPLTIVGKGSKMIVTPNIERLMQTAVGEAVKKEAGRFLEKLGGGKKKGGLFGF